MLKQMFKVVLLVALLVTFVVSSAPARGRGRGCICLVNGIGNGGGCHFKNGQCINTGCKGYCAFNF